MTTLIGVKQRDGESLHEYTKRFRTAREVFESHLGGPIVWNKFVEAMPDYKADDSAVVKRCQEKA
jgi:hypothetical protein